MLRKFKGLKIWQKIVTVFVILVLISLIVPSGSNDDDLDQKDAALNSGKSVEAKDDKSIKDDTTKLIEAKVDEVIDGRTLAINIDGKTEKVRLIGVDLPDASSSDDNVKSKGEIIIKYIESKVDGETIYIEKDASKRDEQDLLLVYVWFSNDIDIKKATRDDVANKQLNGMLIANGYAKNVTDSKDIKYGDYFKALSQNAKDKKLVLWAGEPIEGKQTNNEALNNSSAQQNSSQVSSNSSTLQNGSQASSNSSIPQNGSQASSNSSTQQSSGQTSSSNSNNNVESNGTSNNITNNSNNETPITGNYIGNANTGKFHYAYCGSVKQMLEENKISLASREEAISKGYVPCQRCNP